jgi:hypothetical protein
MFLVASFSPAWLRCTSGAELCGMGCRKFWCLYYLSRCPRAHRLCLTREWLLLVSLPRMKSTPWSITQIYPSNPETLAVHTPLFLEAGITMMTGFATSAARPASAQV